MTHQELNPDDIELIDEADSDDPFGFSELEDDLSSVPTKQSTQQTYPCGQCAGTGLYQGARVHQEKGHCFSCNGTGYFKTDPRKLEQGRARRKARKSDQLTNQLNQFRHDQPDMYAELVRVHTQHTSNSAFIISLAEQLFTKGSLSTGQIAAWHRGQEKLKEIKALKAARAAAAPLIDLSPIKSMFDTAVASGYKSPKYRAEGIVITRAKDHSRNPGCLYIKSEHDNYLGKITPDMRFHGSRDSIGSGVESALELIAKDPLQAALAYGQRTGRCACCGRELTKHASIDAGIGPVCKEKWGF